MANDGRGCATWAARVDTSLTAARRVLARARVGERAGWRRHRVARAGHSIGALLAFEARAVEGADSFFSTMAYPTRGIVEEWREARGAEDPDEDDDPGEGGKEGPRARRPPPSRLRPRLNHFTRALRHDGVRRELVLWI